MAQGSRLDYRTSRLEPPASSGMEVDEDYGAPCSLQQQWASLDLSTGPAQALSEDLACSNCGRCTRRNKLDGSRNGEWLSCRLQARPAENALWHAAWPQLRRGQAAST